MKITADTNTLISATFWHGASDKIISKAEIKAIELVLSDDILKEYSEVLNYEEIQNKVKDKKLEMKRTLGKIMHKNVAKHFCVGFKTPPFRATFLAS